MLELRKVLDQHTASTALVVVAAVTRILETLPSVSKGTPYGSDPKAQTAYEDGYADALVSISERVEALRADIARDYQHAE